MTGRFFMFQKIIMKLSMIFLIVTAIAVTNAITSGIDNENSIQHADDKLLKIINFVCQDKKLGMKN